jgi:hypothetical protein
LLAFDPALRTELRALLPDFHWEKVGLSIEWFAGNAMDYLRVDRDSLTQTGAKQLQTSLEGALGRVVPRHLRHLLRHPTTTDECRLMSLYAHLYADPAADLQDDKNSRWHDLTFDWLVGTKGEKLRLGELVKQDNLLLCIDRHKEFDKDRLRMAVHVENGEPGGHQEAAATDKFQMVARVRRVLVTDADEWRDTSATWRSKHDWFDKFVLKHFYIVKLGTLPYEDLKEDLKNQLNLEREPFLAITQYRLVARNVIGVGHRPYSVDDGSAFRQELALVFATSPRVRAAVPCIAAYRALAVDEKNLESMWHARGVNLLNPRMLCPFEIYKRRLELGHVKQYVEWVTALRKEREGVNTVVDVEKLEKETAAATWRFIQKVDAIVGANQDGLFGDIDRDYNLPHVKKRLENRFNVLLSATISPDA